LAGKALCFREGLFPLGGREPEKAIQQRAADFVNAAMSAPDAKSRRASDLLPQHHSAALHLGASFAAVNEAQ
jgi:hypothetical protein